MYKHSYINTLIIWRKYLILQDIQEGFRAEWCTLRQIQTLIATLQDTQFTNQDIYLLYIDFQNAFGSIDHARLLAIMKDLGYLEYATKLVGKYTHTPTLNLPELILAKPKKHQFTRGHP